MIFLSKKKHTDCYKALIPETFPYKMCHKIPNYMCEFEQVHQYFLDQYKCIRLLGFFQLVKCESKKSLTCYRSEAEIQVQYLKGGKKQMRARKTFSSSRNPSPGRGKPCLSFSPRDTVREWTCFPRSLRDLVPACGINVRVRLLEVHITDSVSFF